MADREFLLKIVGDVSDANKKLGSLEQTATGMQDTGKKIAGGLVAAFAVDKVVDFGKEMVNQASAQEQAIGAANSVFKEYSDEIQAFGETTAKNLGLSNAEFSQLSATTGALLKNSGMPMQEVTDNTIALTERAADLAAMYGGSVPDAVAAMSSALKGEMDPLEKYGVSLKASAVEAKAVEMGLVDAEGKVTDYGKSMATTALIMEQSADAQGTFAKESDTVAGQTAILGAQFKDLQADLGKKLLPIITKVAQALVKMVEFVSANSDWLLPLAGAIGGIVLALKAWTLATKAWEVATKIAAAAQWLWNAAMTANPIGLIVAAIAAVIAIVVLLYTKVDWFRAIVDGAIDAVVAAFGWFLDVIKGVFNWVTDNWKLLLAIITGPIGAAIAIVVTYWDQIKEAVQAVIDFIVDVWSKVFDILVWPIEQWWKVAGPIIKAVPEAVRLVVEAVKTVWTKLFDILLWPIKTAFDAIKPVVDAIPGIFSAMVRAVGSALAFVWDIVSAPFRKGAELAQSAWNSLKDFFKDLPNKIKGFFTGVADIVKAPFEAAFKAIKKLWNDTVGGFGFKVPGWVPGVGGKSFSIPEMASGGIVTKPTIALIGEAGPEAVIPLAGKHGFGDTVVINVYALTANAEVGRQVYNALREYERTTGKRPA